MIVKYGFWLSFYYLERMKSQWVKVRVYVGENHQRIHKCIFVFVYITEKK